MPPKKKEKEQEIDLSTLPEWFGLNCIFKFDCKISRAEALRANLIDQPKSFQKNITKQEVIAFATEKGFYTDPETLTEKQKKDPKALEGLNLELTPEVIAKALVLYQEDQDLQGRIKKKEQIDEANQPQEEVEDPKKQKKDAKKDTKKGGKNEPPPQEEEQEEVIPEKEYKKAQDIMYFLLDLPQNKKEVVAMSQNKAKIDLIIHIKQKVLSNTGDQDMSLLEAKENFEEDFKDRMENFIENNNKEEQEIGEDEEEQAEEEEEEDGEPVQKKHKEIITPEDQQFMDENNQFVEMFKQTRANSDQKEEIRKTVIKQFVWEIDPYAEEESLKIFIDFLIEEICAFSFDIQEYSKWTQDKKTVPLQVVTAPPAPVEEPKKEEEPVEEEVIDPKAKKNAKPAKKDAKKEEPKVEEPPKEVEPPKVEEVKEEKPKYETYFEYNKQLSIVQLEETTTGAILESLLDDIEQENKFNNQEQPSNPRLANEQNVVDNILNDLNNFNNFFKQKGIENYEQEQKYLSQSSKSTASKIIIDEVDETAKNCLQAKFSNLETILDREYNLRNNLLYPGIERHQMPEIPEKSEALRKAEKSSIYPFISCGEHEFERRQTLTRFEDIMKENESGRDWDFSARTYIERHNQNTLQHTLYKCLLFEPILVTKYNEKDDNLYLAMYYKNPPGRVLRNKWSADWKVMPNLENWINFFKNNDNNLRNDIYYDIDYQQIGNLHERVKYMYPTDNSLILGQKFQVGDDFYYRYKVLKEGVIFGIKEQNDEQRLSQFWAVFDNDTRFLVELERKAEDLQVIENQFREELLKRNAQKTQQNLESQQELEAKQAEELEKLKTAGKKLSAKDLKQKEQEIQEQAALIMKQQQDEENQRKQLEEKELQEKLAQVPCKATFSVTLKNGLIVKFLPNGNVFQQKQTTKKMPIGRPFDDLVNPSNAGHQPNSEIEVKRIISGKGTVTKYMKDGSIWIFYANGNTSYTLGRNSPWITTNNKGLRKCRQKSKDAKNEQQYDPLPCAKRTDPESGAKIIIRGDETIIITYRTGQTYVKFKDGTEMTTSPEKDEIIVEHPEFVTVKVSMDFVKARTDTVIGLGSAYANVGFEDLFERSNTGRIVDTYLPDGTNVRGYIEKKELPGYDQFEINNTHLIYFEDGSVCKVVENGEIIFISGVDRINLNKNGGQNEFGKDIDYWLQLFCIPEERKAGVYSIELPEKKLWTKDGQGNTFGLCSDGEIISKIAVSLNVNQNEKQELERPGTPDIQDGEYFIEEENKFLPQPDNVIPPRLFVINNDNTGYEILEEEQIANYKRLKEPDQKNVKIILDENLQYENCDSITYITNHETLLSKKPKFIKPVLPRHLDIMPNTQMKKVQPQTQTFLFRNFLKFQDFNNETREQHFNDLEKYQAWKKEGLRQQADFGILEKSQEEKDKEFNIQLKILESRKRDYQQEIHTYDSIKQKNGEQFIDSFDKIEKSFRARGSNRISYMELSQIEDDNEEQQDLYKSTKKQDSEEVNLKRLQKLEQRKQLDKELKMQQSLKNQLQGVNRFVTNYFQTIQGKHAFDVLLERKEVSLIPSKKKLSKVSAEEINKTINERKSGMGDTQNMNQSQQNLQTQEQFNDTNFRNSNQFNNSQTQQNNTYKQKRLERERQTQENILKPSVFTQRDIDEEERKMEEVQKAYDYRKAKTNNYNVYGTIRNKEKESKQVPCLLRTQPQSELNQKYILTDSLTDNRLKMSSLATRLYQKAPSIQEQRLTGSHTALARTIDKRNNLDDVENRKNLMITADLNDKLRRDLLINPVSARFGVIRIGTTYEMTISVKNEDILAQRVVIKQPEHNKYLKVFMKTLGPIALGLSREITVRLIASDEIYGRFQDSFQIVSKHEIYTIPVYANVLDENDYERLDQESREVNKRPVLKQNVQEVKQNLAGEYSRQEFHESNASDLLPQRPNLDNNIKIDPYNNMNKKSKEDEDEYGTFNSNKQN